MSTDAATPLRHRMTEDMTARKLCAARRGVTFAAASGSLRFSSGPRTQPRRRISAGFNCIFPRRARASAIATAS